MISFFFNEGGSGEIRGRQMGEFLGARLNPEKDFEDDVCIYVKQIPPGDIPKRAYVDIIDGERLIPWLAKHPQCGVIVTSVTAQKYLSTLLKQKPILIPEHHCNYDRDVRTREDITTVGVLGNQNGFQLNIEETEKSFAEMGLAFKYSSVYADRLDVVNFYKTIDIQVCWRPNIQGAHAQLHNPLKLANACSFGIPTVAYPEDNFVAEFDGCFFPATSKDYLFHFVQELATEPRLYNHLSKVGLEKAEEYHIEKVAGLYRNLGG